MTAAQLRTWLVEAAFPFWGEVGLDRDGPGFVEHLTLEGHPADVAFKRIRVQARQIYCFAQAHERSWYPGALTIAARGVDLLVTRAWLGADRGWASTLSRSGDVLDDTPDLYDTAFVLCALGWWLKVSGDTRVVPLAHETLDFLGRHMRHPSQQGYLHRLGGREPHLQNPHMHLLEAMVVLRDVAKDARFADEVDKLVQLCLSHFCDVGTGTLAETFDDNWRRLAGPAGPLLEPGHHYEWVWLLDQAQRGQSLTDQTSVDAAMQALFAFAMRFGQDASGLVVDSVGPDGTVVGSSHRLWPQVERIKALIAMRSRYDVDVDAVLAAAADLVLRHHLNARPCGSWIESFDDALEAKADKIPASSFYHVVLAFAEVLRSEDQRAFAKSTRSPAQSPLDFLQPAPAA